MISLQHAPCSIAIDIGGTNTRIGRFESLSSPQYTLLAKFPTQQAYEQQLRHIFVSIEGSLDSANAIDGIGLTVPMLLSALKSFDSANAISIACWPYREGWPFRYPCPQSPIIH